MRFLNEFPFGLLHLIQNEAHTQNLKSDYGAPATSDFPSWSPQQQQRAPLSLAGPVFDTRGSRAAIRQPQSMVAPDDIVDSNQSAEAFREQSPARAAQNLTVQALRTKGVPEADIAAATGNQELMTRLIMQNYYPGSMNPSASSFSASNGNSVGEGSCDDTGRIYPATNEADDARARRSTPIWGGVSPMGKTDQNKSPIEYANRRNECFAKCSDLALPTGDYGIQFQRCVLACLTDGNSGFSRLG